MEQYSNKIAVVTGASSGIGAHITKALLEKGINVVGLARRKERVEELSKCESNKGTLHALKCDVTRAEEVVAAFKWTEENVGPVTILINSAGVGTLNNVIDGNYESWKQVCDVNILGVGIACREAIDQMKRNKIEGIIINISSIAGHEIADVAGFDMYIASKHALTSLSQSLRLHLRREGLNIRISNLSPAKVDTEIWITAGHFTQDQYENYFKKDLRFMKVDDVTRAVEYILSNPPSLEVIDMIIQSVGEVQTN